MKLAEIVSYLEQEYSLNEFSLKDTSISKRFSLFPLTVYESFEANFTKKSNGLLLRNGEDVSIIIFACFLSDSLCKSILESNISDALLVTHHIYDIDAGTPGHYNAKGFSAISLESYNILKKNRISVFALHLPLDMNESHINTHKALAEVLNINIVDNLLQYPGYTMGYSGDCSCKTLEIINTTFKQHIFFGKSQEKKPCYQVGIIAGMISSTEMLKKIAEKRIDYFICGDVLLRDGSDRMKEIEQYVQNECPFTIVCLSHQWSEEIALLKLKNKMIDDFPRADILFIDGENRWK